METSPEAKQTQAILLFSPPPPAPASMQGRDDPSDFWTTTYQGKMRKLELWEALIALYSRKGRSVTLFRL